MSRNRSSSIRYDSRAAMEAVLLLFSFILPLAPIAVTAATTIMPGTDPLLKDLIQKKIALKNNRRSFGELTKGRFSATSSASTVEAVSSVPSSIPIQDQRKRNLQPNDDFCEQLENDYLPPDSSCSSCDLTNFPETVTLRQCPLANCDICVQDSIRGEVCADLIVETSVFLLDNATGNYDVLQEKLCAQYRGGRTDQVCFEDFYSPENTDVSTSCVVTFNDMTCDSCNIGCDVDCSNIPDGGLAWNDCDGALIPPESPFFIFSNETDTESCFREAVLNANGTISWVIADPHLQTFDGLEYDCNAAGEFVLAELTGYGMQIHGRFEQIDGDAQASVTRGIVVNDNNQGRVQVSLSPAASAPSCDPTFFVDSIPETLIGNSSFANNFVSISVTDDEIAIIFVSTGVQVRLLRRVSASFGGCFFSLLLFIPSNLASSGLQGLYGGIPNGDPSDDWMDFFGNPITVPTNPMDLRFRPAYEYCTTNWCVNELNSIFSFELGESFDSYNFCSVPYNDTLETQVASASATLVNICQGDLACLIDGVAGTEEDAMAYLQDVIRVEQISEELIGGNGSPTAAPAPTTMAPAMRKPKIRKRNPKRKRYGRKRKGNPRRRRRRKGSYKKKINISKKITILSHGGGRIGPKQMGKKAMMGMMKKRFMGKHQLPYTFYKGKPIAPSGNLFKVSVIAKQITKYRFCCFNGIFFFFFFFGRLLSHL